MSLRRRVFLAFAAIVAGTLGVLVIGVATLTRTEWGRGRLAGFVLGQANNAIRGGTLHVGRIDGSIFTGLRIDTLEIRDRNDSLFVAAARLEVDYDPRDLLERRLLLRRVRLGRLVANLFEDSVGMFNFRRIFPSGPPGPPGPPRRDFGHFIKLEDVIVDSAQVTLTTRWRPDTSLTRAEQDSITRFNLGRADKEYWRGPGTIYETRRWTNGRIDLDSARLDDRQPGGRTFAIRHLSIDESDPPFEFRNARGFVRIQGDSIWPDIPHFELPGSAGSLTGKVWWGPGRPTRFDLAIAGDTVSMADIAWVYPTLPVTGGGRMKLAIRSQRDARIIDYVLTDIDVRTTGSRLRGAMTFGVGGPVTILKDVDLSAQPVDFALIEQLSGDPLPYPWRGTITGTLIARGGPLDQFVVDTSDLVFRDANVPGAVTIGQLRGMMNIVEPSLTVFNGVDVHLDQLDLRTLQFLMPKFPRLNGLVAGRATLDSSWLDVRFRNADLTHTDGSGPVTRITGAGRVTFGETTTTYDVALNAQPFSFTTFGRAYVETHVPLKGEYAGPIRLQGTTQDLAVTTELRGPAGLLAYDGRVDGDSIGGYGADGVLSFAGLDLRTLLDTAVTPVTSLNGALTLAVRGDSLYNLAGAAELALERSRFDSILVREGSRVQMRFGDGRLRLFGEDTIGLADARIVASGGFGLGGGVRDSLLLRVTAGSLADLRRYLDVTPLDTLEGVINGRVVVTGNVDSLDVDGAITARDVRFPGLVASKVTVSPTLTNVTTAIGGRIALDSDTLTLGGVRFRDVDGAVNLVAGRAGDYSLLASQINGPVIASGGSIAIEGDTTTVRLDSLSIRLDDKRFTLQRPSAIRVEKERIVVDTVLLAADGASASFAADLPDSLPIVARLAVRALPLSDLSKIAQARLPVGGDLTATIDVIGTRANPRISANASLSGVTAGDVEVAQVVMTGSYADHRVRAEGRVVQADTTVLRVEGHYPIDLSLEARDRRLLDDTMRVRVTSPRVGLEILESFTDAIRSASGSFTLNAELAGAAGRAVLNGGLRVEDGRATLPGMGITLRYIHASVAAVDDTVRIDSLSMRSGPEPDDTFSATGTIAHPLNRDSVAFDLRLRAREFHAIGLPRTVADLYVSANIDWKGTDRASVATGNVEVDRGTIALPEALDKELYSLPPREFSFDEPGVSRLGMVPSPMTRFLAGLSAPDVRITMGPQVWLQSRDARIKLGGSVNVRVDTASVFTENQLVLTGELQTERGTYLLVVSPVQRTFQVESGTLRFTGERGFNPELDIRAVYTSRVVSQAYGGSNDMRIGVHITGTLANPVPILYAADSLLGLSDSDLLSYVLFDQPSFNVGSGPSSLTRLLVNSFSSFASAQATRLSLVDVVQLQTAQGSALGGSPYDIGLEGAQLAIGKQLGDRVFVYLTSGLCQVGQLLNFGSGEGTGTPFWQTLGIKSEWRFGRTSASGVSFSYEPSFDKLLCTAAAGDRAFSTSNKQWGFDLFRTWRR